MLSLERGDTDFCYVARLKVLATLLDFFPRGKSVCIYMFSSYTQTFTTEHLFSMCIIQIHKYAHEHKLGCVQVYMNVTSCTYRHQATWKNPSYLHMFLL